MEKRIIISTSWDKLNFLRRSRENKNLNLLDIKDTDGTTYTYKFICYDHTSGNFVANKSDTNIILIQDSAKLGDLNKAGLTFQNETDYFLHHSNNNGLEEVQGQQFKETTKGAHETAVVHKYNPVFDIILDTEDNKAQRIIEFLFPTEEAKLGEKLDFLHQCLMPNDANTATLKDNWWQDKDGKNINQDNKNGVKKAFTELKELKSTDPFDKPYLEALTTLRDKLLAS